MNKGIWTIAGGTAALCTALIAAPGFTAAQHAHVVGAQEMAEPQVRDFNVMFGEEGGSWLGVETREVTSDNAKELKLPGERGVVLAELPLTVPHQNPDFAKMMWLRKSMGSRWKARCNFDA